MNKCYFGHTNCLLLSRHLRLLADKTVRDWRRVLGELGVSDEKIALNDQDCETRNITDSREIAYQGYLLWQREISKEASFCKLFQALERAGRKDLVDEFSLENDANDLNPIFLQSTAKLFGRAVDLKRLVNFCVCSSSKLLVINGLPGVGKSVLLRNGIKEAHEKQSDIFFVVPMFPSSCAETTWGLEDIAVATLEEINPGKCVIKHRVATLHKKLNVITQPTILVLEIAQLNFKPEGELQFWSFIYEVLSADNNFLKIIVTTCKSPDLSQMNHVKVDHISLKGLKKFEAIKLLQDISPTLSNNQCNKIVKKCSGNPFILLKFAAHIKNFQDHEKELSEFLNTLCSDDVNYSLKLFMRRTNLQRDMRLIFDDLEDDEKITLVKLCCFSEKIKIHSVTRLFGEVVAETVRHLYSNHCLLERSKCGRYYRLCEITRSFIQEYTQNSEVLKNTFLEAKSVYIVDKLKLLLQYDEFFFSPFQSTNMESNLVKSYQNRCKICVTSKCRCILPNILQGSFQRKKRLIIRAIKLGLNHIDEVFSKTLLVCFQTLHFLRNYLANEELCMIYDLVLKKVNERGDKFQCAAAMASTVLVKVYHSMCHENVQNISILTESIIVLEKFKLKLPTHYLELLAIYYLNRGYLQGYYNNRFKAGLKDIDKGRIILTGLPSTPKIAIEELSVFGFEAAIYYRNNMFQKSYNQREIQVDGYRKYLGIHPFTAKTLQYHGQCLLKLKHYDHAITCCLISYQMYLKVDGKGFTTMRVLSIYGKVMLSKGAVQEGIKKLKLAIQHGEELFGEHDCVASCYEELAEAKESIDPKDSEISSLKAKASEIRTQFNRKISNSKHKFSRLDSFNEEKNGLKKPFKCFKKLDYSFCYIAILMVIAVVFRFMLESISVSCNSEL